MGAWGEVVIDAYSGAGSWVNRVRVRVKHKRNETASKDQTLGNRSQKHPQQKTLKTSENHRQTKPNKTEQNRTKPNKTG